MNFATIVNFLLIAGVIQGFGFNLVTLFIKKKFTKVIIFLNLIVLFISLNNLQRVLIDSDFFSFSFLLNHFQVPWYVLVIPMFYTFTTYFLKVEKKVNGFIKLTIIVFILEIIIRLCLISYVYYEVPDYNTYIIERYTRIEEICNLFYCVFLFITTCLIIFRKHRLLEYILGYDDLNWLKWFIRLGSMAILFWILAVVMLNVYKKDAYDLLRLSSSVLLYWIGYQGFYKYNVVHDRIFLRTTIESNRVLISPKGTTQSSKENDNFFNEKHEKDFNNIRGHIIKNKLYLDPLLSAEMVTTELRISKSYFSKLINSYSSYNFSDFINLLRVEQAKQFLSNDEFRHYTNVSIGLECGFNSKSTFYSAFKKFTSQTPTEFKEQFS
jgi:AraC-like DNA-binding protein